MKRRTKVFYFFKMYFEKRYFFNYNRRGALKTAWKGRIK